MYYVTQALARKRTNIMFLSKNVKEVADQIAGKLLNVGKIDNSGNKNHVLLEGTPHMYVPDGM